MNSILVLSDFYSKFEKYMKSQVEEMILFAGEPKYMLYRTDWPIANMETYISFLNKIKLPEERKELIAWKNSAKLFNIDI